MNHIASAESSARPPRPPPPPPPPPDLLSCCNNIMPSPAFARLPPLLPLLLLSGILSSDATTGGRASCSASAALIADRHAFDRDGYLHVPGFFSGAELARLKRYAGEIERELETIGGQMMYFERSRLDNTSRILSRVEDFTRRHAGMHALLADSGRSALMEFTSSIVRLDNLVLFKDKINLKLPGGDGFRAHQDSAAGWERYVDWFISVAVFIDDATVENGCIEVAAGQHTKGLLGEVWTPIDQLPLEYTSIEANAGDLILFDSYVPHRSTANFSPKPRRVLIATYNDVRAGDHRDRYFQDKRDNFPPDCERQDGVEYRYKV